MKTVKHITLAVILVAFFANGICQTNGDEESSMWNNPELRDQKAIDEAMNGWWKNSMISHDKRIAWWRESRFGMFIHWGVYSVPGGEWEGRHVTGYAEHLMRKEKIPVNEYVEKLVKPFNPVNFNADEWVKTAKNGGMKYFVITAKHHDGFALYDSEVTDYNVVDASKFGRDPMVELAEACRKYGIKFGFYYSHAFDWEHPDAPGNDWDYNNPGGDLNLFGGRNWYEVHPQLMPRVIRYVNEKSIPQIRELIQKYKPDLLWFDTPHKLPFSENLRILEEIRKLDKTVVVNGRLARTGFRNFGDYKNTSDRPLEFYPVEGDWEAIPTTNESYGYHRYDDSHKPASFFIRLLAKAASRGGNLLMNIGPMGDGAFDPRDLKILEGIGGWMKNYGESIYGTEASPLPLQNWGVVTKKDATLYLHVFDWPKNGTLAVGGLQGIQSAYLMNNPGLTLKNRLINKGQDLVINLPKEAPDSINSVIVVEVKNTLKAGQTRLIEPDQKNILLAFDGEVNGKGLYYGDGKAGRYYIAGWENNSQYVLWRFRLPQNSKYEVYVKYESGHAGDGFIVESGIQKLEKKFETGNRGILYARLGKMTFSAGENTLTIKSGAEGNSKTGGWRVFQIDLLPVTNKISGND